MCFLVCDADTNCLLIARVFICFIYISVLHVLKLWRSCLRFWQCCQEYHQLFYMEIIDNFLIEKKAKVSDWHCVLSYALFFTCIVYFHMQCS